MESDKGDMPKCTEPRPKPLAWFGPFCVMRKPLYIANILWLLSVIFIVASANGTIVVIITPETLEQLKNYPSFTFSDLKTSKKVLYYIDEEDLLSAARNLRLQCFGGNRKWSKISTKNSDRQSRESLDEKLREIVSLTLEDHSPVVNGGGKFIYLLLG